MSTLYERTDGRMLDIVPVPELASQLGWQLSDAEAAVEYLEQECLLSFPVAENAVSITHLGVVEVEQALAAPNEPTTHFAPLNLVYVQGDVVSSQIQSGGTGNAQRQRGVLVEQERAHIDEFLAEFRRSLADEHFPAVERREAEVFVDAIEAQLTLPEPNETVVREGLQTLRSVAENLAASGMFMGLIELARHIHF